MDEEIRKEVLRLKREKLKARLLRSIEQDEIKRSTYTVSNDWVDDIIAINYLSMVLKGIFHISPFQHIETTFKLVKIKI